MASQLNEDYLRKLVAERQANLANAAQMGAQNPEPYNPRAEWLRQNTMNAMNRQTPLTAEQVMAQLKGTAINPNAGSYNPQLNAMNAAQQTPQADFGGAGGKQAGTPPTTYSQTAPTASEFGASKVYKPTNYGQQFLDKYAASGGNIANIKEYAAGMAKNPNAYNGIIQPEVLKVAQEYSAAVKQDNDALQDGMIQEVDGKQYVWNKKSGSWLEGKEINKQANAYQTLQTYNEIYKPYYNANKTALDNLKYLEQVSPIDNPIAQVIPLTEEFLAAKAKAQKEADNPTGMDEQNQSAAIIKQNAGPTDLEGKMRGAYGGYTTPEGMKRYEDMLYESMAQRLRNEAGDLRGQQAADLAARGLGMSTVVNDVQAETNKRLMQGLGEAGSRAAVGAEELRRGYLQDAQNLESGIANRGLQAGTQMSNVGAQKQNIYQSAQSPYMQAIQYQDANSMLNLGLQNQAWKDKVANAQYLLNLPQQINAGQAGTQNTAAQVGTNIYGAGLVNAAGQNQLAGQVGSQLAGALANKPNTGFVPLQQVQGGFTGAVTGANAGFKKPVNTTGAFQM